MPIEIASNISELNQSWPLGGDSFKDGDDHIRILKTAIKATFANINAPITGTPVQFNYLTDNKTAIEAIVDQSNTHTYIPSGFIGFWSGTDITIPVGWFLCDGLNGTPDLRDRFALGSPDGTRGAVGTSHDATSSTAGSHSHGSSTGSHILTADEIPNHNHSITFLQQDGSGGDVISGSSPIMGSLGSPLGNVVSNTTSIGGGAGHTHSIGADGNHEHTVDTRGKYYKLAYIMKA